MGNRSHVVERYPGEDVCGSGPTILIGLIGSGIQLSRSPRMHEVEGAHFGLRYVYRLLDSDRMGEPHPNFEEILRAAEIAGFAGVNVTYPYKREAVAFLDELSETARTLGAVNTILLKEGRRFGHNTDCWGFAESFRRDLPGAARETVLLLGAGGAGGAVAAALLGEGVERLLIFDREPDVATQLVRRLAAATGKSCIEAVDDPVTAVVSADGLVNATPVGMEKVPGTPIPPRCIMQRQWVADIIYFPIETELLRAARKKGCRTLPGSGMAVFQAVRAFELFTGLKPSYHRMRATFDAFVG